MEQFNIIWDNEAKKGLRNIISYIKNNSPQNAEMVKNSVFKFVDTLIENPNRCTQLRNNKKLNIRFHIVKGIKVIFEVQNNTVAITNILHAKRRVKV